MSESALPQSMRFALWFTAWVCGDTSLDDARDGILGDDAAHDVAGIPGRDEPQPLIVALGAIKATGGTGAGIALPVPGDPLGLGGPAGFNAEVLEAGEGVVVEGAELGLVPHRAGAGVVWTCATASDRRQLPDATEADQQLRRALLETGQALSELDVARWRPEVADELLSLRRPRSLSEHGFPACTPPGAVRLASLALRCRTIVDLALADDGGALTAAEADARRRALLPLEQAARRALVASTSRSLWPPR